MLQVVLANWIIIPSMILLHIVLFMVKHQMTKQISPPLVVTTRLIVEDV